jgi:TM2 domain-containing membrane protein YozV
MSSIELVSGIVQVVVLFIAAYFSYAIHTHNRVSKAWLAVSTGLVLMGLHRLFSLLVGMGALPGQSIDTANMMDVGLPLIYSLLLAAGLMYMKGNFERFEILESRAREKFKAFHKSRKGK